MTSGRVILTKTEGGGGYRPTGVLAKGLRRWGQQGAFEGHLLVAYYMCM